MAMDIDVWAVYPTPLNARLASSRHRLRKECERRGWFFHEKPTFEVRINPAGRTREILSSPEATNLYRRVHRARVALLSFAESHVCVNPNYEIAIRHGRLITLAQFLRYKCFYEVVRHPDQFLQEDIENFAGRYAAYCQTKACEDEHDPRCLPLHVFKQKVHGLLDQPEERAEFDRLHGAGSVRTDDEQREWRLFPRNFHGHEQLHVCGLQLRHGFHWDVQPGGNSTLIVTTKEVWKVSHYVNIYPDAHVRGNKPHATRVA